MKLNALLLSFGLVGSLYSMCQQGRAADCTNAPTAPAVVPLGPNFDAIKYGDCDVKGNPCDKPPAPGTVGTGPGQVPPLPDTAVTDIHAAFAVAPSFFKTELCNLSNIYIDTIVGSVNPIAWGIWERLYPDPPDPNVPRIKEIGISALVWSTLKTAAAEGKAPYSVYENYILAALLTPPPPIATQWMNGNSNTTPDNALFYTASPDPAPTTPNEMAILGILAHEMGHIIWWEKRVRDKKCSVSGLKDYFHKYSWSANQVAHGFHRFGRETLGNRTKDRPDNEDVASDLHYGDYPYANADQFLKTIYNGEWASLFATVSPDEDFVETYKLWVLTDAGNSQPLQQLQITIPDPGGQPAPSNILSNFSNSSTILSQKAKWIQQCLVPWP